MTTRKVVRTAFPLAMSVLLAWAGLAAAPGRGRVPEPKSVKNVGWELRGARVVSLGQRLNTSRGVLTSGYQIEAAAVPRGDHPLFAGKFQATLSIFSPSQPMPGQQPGKWYVGGSWTITSPGAGHKQQVRENELMAKGTLTAQLSFDPSTKPGAIDALLHTPRLSAAGWRTPVKGVLSGNEKLEGTISFALRSWK